mmetsp:Transcript_19646/g.34805  ORF Transcript_19646/g.34805 Transcript_19646/m.34805 type:complete len:783 (-) Transcript_19646:76-2424(-)
MSFFANLFNLGPAETTPPALAAPQPTYNFERLQLLYERLSRFRESDLEKAGEGDALIETVRQITEALIWGEQNNSQFFDFFCEKSIFSDLVRVLGLRRAPKKVKLQLLQTLSMLIQNIRRQTSVYYILSNNHVNRLMSTQMDFEDDEILAYYITLMKSLAMRLDTETIKFFFIQHPEPTFPLYIEATKFYSHRDHMVRATVRTITLQVYRIDDQPMRRFVLRHAAQSYFSELAGHLRELWRRLDAAAAAADEDDMSGVQRENELQQDLQIYLSDVFELGIAELNEVLADRLLNGALLPVLLAGLASVSRTPTAGAKAATIAPQVALFLIRQVLDTFHSPVLLEPLAQALLWPTVPAALAFALPFPEGSSSVQADFVANPLRDCFLSTLQSKEDRNFLLAAGIVHGCLTNRRALSQTFLETAGLLPSRQPSETKKSGYPGKAQASTRPEETPQTVTFILEAMGQRTSWQIEPYKAFVRILIEVVSAANMPAAVHAVASRSTSLTSKEAAKRVHELVREATAGEDGGMWLVDTFCEEWEQHKAALPHLPEFFADPRRLIVGGRASLSSRRPSQRGSGGEIQKAVRHLLLTRRQERLLRGLANSNTSAGSHIGGEPEWTKRSEETLPLQLPDEASSRPREGNPIAVTADQGIACELCKTEGRQPRHLMLDSSWLVLARSSSSTAEVTTVWPIWQVQSLVDRSDPRTLQIGLNAHKPGMPPGEAVAYNPPVSSYFTLTLSFQDVGKCNDAAVHLQARRRAVRSQMVQKASTFVEACSAVQGTAHSF